MLGSGVADRRGRQDALQSSFDRLVEPFELVLVRKARLADLAVRVGERGRGRRGRGGERERGRGGQGEDELVRRAEDEVGERDEGDQAGHGWTLGSREGC